MISLRLALLYMYIYALLYMADHVGGRRSVVNPSTKLWRPPVEVTQIWRPRNSFGARFRFCKTKQN